MGWRWLKCFGLIESDEFQRRQLDGTKGTELELQRVSDPCVRAPPHQIRVGPKCLV